MLCFYPVVCFTLLLALWNCLLCVVEMWYLLYRVLYIDLIVPGLFILEYLNSFIYCSSISLMHQSPGPVDLSHCLVVSSTLAGLATSVLSTVHQMFHFIPFSFTSSQLFHCFKNLYGQVNVLVFSRVVSHLLPCFYPSVSLFADVKYCVCSSKQNRFHHFLSH